MAKQPPPASQISFKNPSERQFVVSLGLQQLEKGEVSQKYLEFGKRYKKKIESGYEPKASIRFVSDRVGDGAFAEERLKEGAYVAEYAGLVRENVPFYFVPINPYCYEYPLAGGGERGWVIDGRDGGNFTRFINHSYTPNLQPMYAFIDGLYHLIFLSLRQIEKGEQLCYNYGSGYWSIRPPPEPL